MGCVLVEVRHWFVSDNMKPRWGESEIMGAQGSFLRVMHLRFYLCGEAC